MKAVTSVEIIFLFGAQGFSKLESKYQGHASEKRDFAQQFANRILDLGGELVLSVGGEGQSLPIRPLEWLKLDHKLSTTGFSTMSDLLADLSKDVTTYDILKDFYKDEEEDLYWIENQLDLIETIGYQNWMVRHL